MKQNNFGLYKTSDLTICVILQYFGCQLVSVDKSDRSKCIFYLNEDENTVKILENFYQGKLLVEPKKFIFIQKETKGRIYN